MSTPTPVDVLCVGYACVDINFNAAHHPTADEKLRATSMHTCGGGPAANAAVTIARLGGSARFSGYLGNDTFGEAHLREFANDGVHADGLQRGDAPTPVAAVTIKPNGERSIIDYRSPSAIAAEDTISLAHFPAKVLLIDGHQPLLSLTLIEEARFDQRRHPTTLQQGRLPDYLREIRQTLQWRRRSTHRSGGA